MLPDSSRDPETSTTAQTGPASVSEATAQRLAAIVESSDDAIVSKDLNGIIQTWNKSAERIFGFTAAEAIGRSITLIIPPERLDEETEVLRRIAAGEPVDHFETVRRAKDGRLIDISLTVSPIRASDGRIIGASKVARDITEQRQLRRALEDANTAKDQFLGMLSHELRTPLNTVLGYTEMLRNNMLPDEQQKKAISIIAKNAEALTRLVNDVLDTSRIVTGKIRLERQDCDVSMLVADAVDGIRPAAEAKGVHIECSIPPDQRVTGDPDRLRQIFWNLTTNAVKFTPAGGKVTVAVKPAGGSVCIVVQDTGVGLSPESLPLVFQRFWQAESGGTRAHGGLGLGLALARHFVELHGGDISVHSDGVGKGSTFEVRLRK